MARALAWQQSTNHTPQGNFLITFQVLFTESDGRFDYADFTAEVDGVGTVEQAEYVIVTALRARAAEMEYFLEENSITYQSYAKPVTVAPVPPPPVEEPSE